ncbi:alpha/beta hydrolase [Larkinella soli]|uniref:alpha/beta hydrolase n=1 Tax=Larkinella soli TaxID=1770527 RepID=UPI00286D6CCD|nr:alpha/beta hydrolase-fold protein [Larkinella soli]
MKFIWFLWSLMGMGEFLTAVDASGQGLSVRKDEGLVSAYLNRPVVLEVILPPGYSSSGEGLPVLYLNDGQDLERLRMAAVLDSMFRERRVRAFVLVAIHAGDRIQEYGVAAQADYLHRGSKAGRYSEFVLHELIPYVKKHYRITDDPERSVFAGFSLGGLSAFDLVWNHPSQFRKAGAFSGSFWWRQKGLNEGYTDDDRIMHALVRKGTSWPGLRFWFQTGTLDETDDRDHDGVIDSIDDTLDLIAELERKGYRWGNDVTYAEVKGGRHDPETWSRVMPDFLTWAFGPAR